MIITFPPNLCIEFAVVSQGRAAPLPLVSRRTKATQIEAWLCSRDRSHRAALARSQHEILIWESGHGPKGAIN